MSDIEWGEPIAVNGKRPDWLNDPDQSVFFQDKCDLWYGDVIGWTADELVDGDVFQIRLPKDHWAYLTDREDRRVEYSQTSPRNRAFLGQRWEMEDKIARFTNVRWGKPMKITFPETSPYHHLSTVLDEALEQASEGKGRERHAQDLPFHDQPMQQLIDLYGMGFALGQAGKKMQESQRLPHDAARAELLGAIVYIAGAIVAMDRAEDTE